MLGVRSGPQPSEAPTLKTVPGTRSFDQITAAHSRRPTAASTTTTPPAHVEAAILLMGVESGEGPTFDLTSDEILRAGNRR